MSRRSEVKYLRTSTSRGALGTVGGGVAGLSGSPAASTPRSRRVNSGSAVLVRGHGVSC